MADKFKVYFKDTDPDTGILTQVKVVCWCEEEKMALFVKDALEKEDCDEPNREYYVCTNPFKTEDLIVCVDPDQLEISRKFQIWCADHGVRCVICFGVNDLARVRQTYADLGVKYMLTIIGLSNEWDEVEGWELRMSAFDEENDFDVVYSLLY